MHRVLSLPASLLALLATALLPSALAHDSNTSPGDARIERLPDYLLSRADQTEPERRAHHEVVSKRHEAIEARLATQAPIGMRKMSGDPSEKFFPDYWFFEDLDSDSTRSAEGEDRTRDTPSPSRNKKRSADAVLQDAYQNLTTTGRFEPPLQLHQSTFGLRYSPGDLFKRDYQCPTGFHTCASIGNTGTCCTTDQTCQIITNSGIGTIGCCPSGLTCSGSVGSCDISQGYSSCPTYQNPDGCCSPGFECDNVGCKRLFNAVNECYMITDKYLEGIQGTGSATTITTTAAVVPASYGGVTTKTLVETAVVAPQGPSTVYITTTTPTATVIISAAGLSTATTVITTTVTSATAAAPVRPNSDTSTLVYTTSVNSICPTNYYRCSAYYLGGCCQVGQDCDSTNCPSMGSTTVATNSVVTVFVGTGEGITTIGAGSGTAVTTIGAGAGTVTVAAAPTTTVDPVATVVAGAGACPSAWFSCGADVGGGCCPSGYGCAATCSATQAGLPDTVQKVQPSNSAIMVRDLGYWMMGLAGVLGIGMVCL